MATMKMPCAVGSGGGSADVSVTIPSFSASQSTAKIPLKGLTKISADSYVASNGNGGYKLYDEDDTSTPLYNFASGTTNNWEFDLTNYPNASLYKNISGSSSFTCTFTNLKFEYSK